ncbi:hypothetical protein [Amycolatopsis acididurans]|nr:hypothetical protein [Amycolatopsis acididurans]
MRTTFSEVMAGNGRLALDVEMPGVLHPFVDVVANASGRVEMPGLADDPAATGTVEIAPVTRRRIRYRLDFTALDGRRLHLDGWKSIRFLRPLWTMTTLPATVTDASGAVVAELSLRFDIRRELWAMLRSFRLVGEHLRPKWKGRRGRLEVWYTTLTDPESGTGFWVHHELVAPTSGEPAFLHGWAAVFPPGETPVLARFGPERHPAPLKLAAGEAGDVSWDLQPRGAERTLFTFPRWAWLTGLLPAAQIVPRPAVRFQGRIRCGKREFALENAPGATAHIYGHGNAQRWAWLHADLGDGDVAEVVAAVSTRPGMRRLPPLPFVRLRLGGRDLPAGDPLLGALRLHAELDLPTWRVRGRLGQYTVDIEVTQPPEATVAVDYQDPDGSPAVCHNTERATAHIVLRRREGGAWIPHREWHLGGTAHAEVGTRD